MRPPDPTSTRPTLVRERAPSPGPLRPYDFPETHRFSLPNGVAVVYAHVEGLPVVTVSTLVRAGAAHEAPTRAGLATLTGSLLESGAAGRSGPEIAESLESLGAQLVVGSSWDYSFAEVTGVAATIRDAARMLAELVQLPDFPEAEVERLRNQQLAGVMQRRADPRELADEMASRFLFSAASPYSRAPGGNTATVPTLTREDVVGFHRGGYTAARTSLVIAGSLGPDEAAELAAGFARGAAHGDPPPAVASEAAAAGRRVVLVDRPGSVQSEIRVGHLGAPRSSPDYFALVVMNTVLGGAFTSRLNLNLRERQGFTYGASSAFSMRVARGPFLVSTAVQTEVTAASVREIFHEIATMRDAPVTAQELDDARNYLAGIFPLTLQTTSGVAARLSEIALHGLPEDYFERYPSHVLGVTAEDAHRVAREYLQPERAAVVIVGDAAAIRDEIEALGLGPIEVVDPSGVA